MRVKRVVELLFCHVLFSEEDFVFHHTLPGFDLQSQVFHWSVAFNSVTRTAKQLIVFVIIASAFSLRYNVVNFEIPNLEVVAASVAFAVLLLV